MPKTQDVTPDPKKYSQRSSNATVDEESTSATPEEKDKQAK